MNAADRFFELHVPGAPFVIGNVWDAASARVFETSGFAALATSSAAVAWSLGYPDGEIVDTNELYAAIARIVRVVRVPVSADLEAGFGATPTAIAGTCERALATGIVGVNLEDFDATTGELFPIAIAVERIRAFRARADTLGKRLFINARTDVMLRAIGPTGDRTHVVIERLQAYAGAGADGAFVPGIGDVATIGAIAHAVRMPLNVLLMPGIASLNELAAVGVARVSIGSSPMTRLLGVLRDLGNDVHAGRFAYVDEPKLAYADCNALFTKST